jgi:hypothetical protein
MPVQNKKQGAVDLTTLISPRIFQPMQTQFISANSIIAKRLWLAYLAHCRSAFLF